MKEAKNGWQLQASPDHRIGVGIKNDTEEIALVSNRAEILALKRVILF